ncbi:MAG TPA: apolipoprotein N-acyltransferase, partial [Vicinamibacterales bacterium]|nr:apolipoprotein N-acyltransferase [Vicinamibacterales bacterium]
ASPVVWVTTELGRTYLFTGFPWVLLGYSQTPVLPIAQISSVFGVYGVSALVAAVSAALAFGATEPGAAHAGHDSRHPDSRLSDSAMSGFSRSRRAWTPLAATFVVIVGIAIWGSVRVGRAELTRTGEAMRVGLIQGNIDQPDKWEAARAATIFRDYLSMTRQAIGAGAQLIIWPESSLPYRFEDDPAVADRVRNLARQARVPILFGSDQVEWRTQNNQRVPIRYFNSAFLVSPDGSTGGVYRKMHLVPFGEYVPLKRIFFFAAPLVEAVSDFSAGDDAVLLPVNGHPISTAICYEIVYPGLVRRFVQGGSELLTTITNDAWFGRTSAPYQHFEQASMRAIEEGRYLVRAANTGISGIVDPYGRVLAVTGIFQPAVTVGDIRFLRTLTVYARIGDVFAYASAVLTLLLLALPRRRRYLVAASPHVARRL